MRIGVDFDNTIVCYDEVFHKVALEGGYIPTDLSVSKGQVRDYLRRSGKEDIWTEMQGYVYGMCILDAKPFPGVKEFFGKSKELGIPVDIISHRTKYPYMGPKYDLHMAAVKWLETQGFFEPSKLGLSRTHFFLELTKADKIKRIVDTGCTHFIDDLPEFLLAPSFPKNVISILFDPNNSCEPGFAFQRVSSWAEVLKELKNYE